MVNEITGFTENPKNHQDFAEKILILMKNPAMAEKMGKAARLKVEKDFSTRSVTAKNILFYKGIIDSW